MKLGARIKRTRGETMCKNIHARTLEERIEVTLNEHGQPIGPTDRAVSDLSLFLGTLARNSAFCPLLYTSWASMPDENLERVWNYTKVNIHIFCFLNIICIIIYKYGSNNLFFILHFVVEVYFTR
ncbi:hypothetical protein KSP40_PGU010096 [Platanthera guangdongensis]|uniref:Uncharacterized protein n=1 Tax=Platanthera guangdongensis TaxID=2320717 RepID=A0ABR2M322_9ASPA